MRMCEKHPVLTVSHLKKTYGFVRALDDVSFEIGRGEVYGLIGESGCGKATLARCIMNMERWDAGDIYISEEKIGIKQSRKKKRMLLRKRAIIFQENAAALNTRLSVRSILKEPFAISRTPYTTETLRSLMEKCGLDPSLLERPARTLSGGQLQRLCIARAIALSPDLVVADEPTASLDLSMQAQIINLFKDLQEKEGFAFLLIGHDLDLIEFAADRIGVMHDGKIVEQGSRKEVFGSPAHEYTRSLLRSTLHVYEKKEGEAR